MVDYLQHKSLKITQIQIISLKKLIHLGESRASESLLVHPTIGRLFKLPGDV